MNKFKKLFDNVILSIISIIIFFMLLEIAARIYLMNFAGEERFRKYASLEQINKRYKNTIRYVQHRYIGYHPAPNFKKGENKHNSLGFRGDEIIQPKPKGEFRIACLGGSTTYTGHVEDYRFSYPDLLEKELQKQGHRNVKVVNSGAGGWSSWESLINFQFRLLDLYPDMIIIYHGINDVETRLVWPPGAYKGDNSGRRIFSAFTPSIFESSTVIRFFLLRMGLIYSHGLFAKSIDILPKTYYRDEFINQKLSNTYPSGIFKKISAKKMVMTNKPIYFKRNIENIVAIANHLGIKTILATFAHSPLFVTSPTASSEEHVLALNETNKILKVVAMGMGVNLFDFASYFPKEKQYYSFDGIHLNAKGAKLKAKLFARYIVEKNLISVSD
jgi:lysophospholipase L1-like esterase